MFDHAVDRGLFGIVLARGLFDYLEEPFARALIPTALSRLLRPGGTFYFSNIAAPNPCAALMTHICRWRLGRGGAAVTPTADSVVVVDAAPVVSRGLR
ncbi:hypothetical protein [Streptomyces sp. NPDC048462]|uniref:hypothetical protein n=1 Tax=Streptomyces sp. NPDC048462 TaxID=3365555 RepID=UPI00371BC0E4